jgi:hypothetical protein
MCNVRLYITCLQKNSEKQIIIKKVDCVALISLMSLDQFTLFVTNAVLVPEGIIRPVVKCFDNDMVYQIYLLL